MIHSWDQLGTVGESHMPSHNDSMHGVLHVQTVGLYGPSVVGPSNRPTSRYDQLSIQISLCLQPSDSDRRGAENRCGRAHCFSLSSPTPPVVCPQDWSGCLRTT